jgi:4,5-dihydroxyphthalate decarboxylase
LAGSIVNGRLQLTLGCGDYDINMGLVTGEIQPEGITLAAITLPSPERHWRMMASLEFDVCELSMASYLLSRDQRAHPFIAIPVFPHRRFRHGYIFVNASSGIKTAKALEGRKVGLRTWQTTAGLWTRGILEEYYGVDITKIHWVRQDPEDIPFDMPPEFSATTVEKGQNVNDMCVNGELDALIFPEIPSSFKKGDPRIRRLFPNVKEEEIRFFKDTGYFPIMHTVVITDEVLARYPWVGQAMLKAFRQSKELAYERMEDPRRISLAWVRDLIEEQREIMGRDPWPYELPANRKALEAMIRYSHRQGMIKQQMPVESLFHPASLQEMPVGYV